MKWSLSGCCHFRRNPRTPFLAGIHIPFGCESHLCDRKHGFRLVNHMFYRAQAAANDMNFSLLSLGAFMFEVQRSHPANWTGEVTKRRHSERGGRYGDSKANVRIQTCGACLAGAKAERPCEAALP